MNRLMISAIATALLISPLAVNAASLHWETNNFPESRSTINQLAQNRFQYGKRMGRGGRMEKLLQQLDLTPEQSQQIEAIQEQFRTDNETLRQEMQANHQEMRSLLASDSSPEQLRQQHQQLQSLRQQLGTNHFETMLQVREILTPEQRNKMAELMAQYREKRGSF